jgi:hypothetical protein
MVRSPVGEGLKGFQPPVLWGESFIYQLSRAHMLGVLPFCCHVEAVKSLKALVTIHGGQECKRSLDTAE